MIVDLRNGLVKAQMFTGHVFKHLTSVLSMLIVEYRVVT